MTERRHEYAEPVTGVLKIAQVTDCHVSADGATTYRGQNPVVRLQAVLDDAVTRQPELLLATGDLSEDGSADSYALLHDMFAATGVPVLALPGNHDEPALVAEHFPGSPVDDVQVTDHGAWQIIRINSCLPGNPSGQITEQVLAALEETLQAEQGRPRLLALHHQPLATNSPWIDKYRLMDAGPLLELIERHLDIKAVVWGHIHQVFEQKINDTLMLGGPSSVANSLPGTESFTPDDKGPAYRWLELGNDGTVKAGIVTVSLD